MRFKTQLCESMDAAVHLHTEAGCVSLLACTLKAVAALFLAAESCERNLQVSTGTAVVHNIVCECPLSRCCSVARYFSGRT